MCCVWYENGDWTMAWAERRDALYVVKTGWFGRPSLGIMRDDFGMELKIFKLPATVLGITQNPRGVARTDPIGPITD